uniref:LORF2 protein n=1 Tax=Steinernema glaseri TaxID=37863 RepID=A0A1I8AKW1_9BILA
QFIYISMHAASIPLPKSSEYEMYRLHDEKICRFGWALLLLWTFVICYITKEYWMPGFFTQRSMTVESRYSKKGTFPQLT